MGPNKNVSHTRTNKYFRDKFRGMAGTRKTGHLVDQRDKDDNVLMEDAELMYIIKAKKDKDGWHVKLKNEKEYDCYYESALMVMPECVETDEKLVPKGTVTCVVSADKISGIYKITKINDLPSKFATLEENDLTIGDKDAVNLFLKGQNASIALQSIAGKLSKISLDASQVTVNDVNIISELEKINKRLDEIEKTGSFTPDIVD